MEFTVITEDGSEDNYSGEAAYQILDSGILEVQPRDPSEPVAVFYSPAEWRRLHVP
jgi:hypothetical protein